MKLTEVQFLALKGWIEHIARRDRDTDLAEMWAHDTLVGEEGAANEEA